MEKRRIIVVGSGNRVKSTHLPALRALTSECTLIGVIAKHAQDLSFWYGKPLTATTNYEDVDVSSIDFAIISVPPKAVGDVLARLSRYPTKRLTLLIDTPGIHVGHLRKLRALRAFKAAYSLEDFPELPAFLTIRRIIERGDVGTVRRIHLVRSAAFHHALALIRALSSARSFSLFRRTPLVTRVSSTNGAHSFLTLPASYDEGSFLIEGTRGTIGSSEGAAFVVRVRKTAGNGYAGVSVNGTPEPPSEEESLYRATFPRRTLEGVSIHEPLWLNEMKVIGVMRLVRRAARNDTTLDQPLDAVYDLLPLPFLERFGFFIDIPLGKRGSLVRFLLRLVSGT